MKNLETKAFNLELPLELWKKLKIHCVNNNITIREFLTELIKNKLA